MICKEWIEYTLFSPLRTAACSGVLPSLSWRLNRLPLKYPGASPAAGKKVRCDNVVKNTNMREESPQLKVRKWYFLSDFSHYNPTKMSLQACSEFSHYNILTRQENKWLCTTDVYSKPICKRKAEKSSQGTRECWKTSGFHVGICLALLVTFQLNKRNVCQPLRFTAVECELYSMLEESSKIILFKSTVSCGRIVSRRNLLNVHLFAAHWIARNEHLKQRVFSFGENLWTMKSYAIIFEVWYYKARYLPTVLENNSEYFSWSAFGCNMNRIISNLIRDVQTSSVGQLKPNQMKCWHMARFQISLTGFIESLNNWEWWTWIVIMTYSIHTLNLISMLIWLILWVHQK